MLKLSLDILSNIGVRY